MLKQTICLDMRANLSRKQNRSHDFFRDARSIALQSSYMQIRAKLFVLNNTLVPEDFLDFSPHERAAREPRSASLLSHAVKTQENPLDQGTSTKRRKTFTYTFGSLPVTRRHMGSTPRKVTQ